MDFHPVVKLDRTCSGLSWSGKSEGKTKIVQGEGIKVWEILLYCQSSERSGNLLVKSNTLCTKSIQKWKELENEEKNIYGLQRKLKET